MKLFVMKYRDKSVSETARQKIIDQAEQVIHDLQGTCNSFYPDEYPDEVVDMVDQEIFECTICGWWSERCMESEEATEAHGEPVCIDCEDDFIEA